MFRVLKCSRDTQMFELQMWTINPSFTVFLASPIQKTEEGAQNHKHRSRGPTSLLVATDEVTVTDGSIFVARSTERWHKINQTPRNKKPCKSFVFFPSWSNGEAKITSSFAFLRGPHLLHRKTSSRTVPRKRERKQWKDYIVSASSCLCGAEQ